MCSSMIQFMINQKKKSDPKAKSQSKEAIEIYSHSRSDLTYLNNFNKAKYVAGLMKPTELNF